MSQQITVHRSLLDALSLDENDMEHPTEESLVDFQNGRLPEEQVEMVESHLLSCRECSDFVQAAEAFAAPEEELPPVDPAEILSGLRELHQRLGKDEGNGFRESPSAPPREVAEIVRKLNPAPPSGPRRTWLDSSALGYGLAATLLFVVFGVLAAKSRDTSRLAELEAWKATEGQMTSGFSLHPLEPWGTFRGDDEVPKVRGGDILMLFGEGRSVDGELVLEMTDASGQVTQRVREFSTSQGGDVLVRVPQFGLEPGRYELVLWLADLREVIAKYKIEVIEPSP